MHAWLCVAHSCVSGRPSGGDHYIRGDHQFVLESGVHDRPQARVPVRTDKGDDGPVRGKIQGGTGGCEDFQSLERSGSRLRQDEGMDSLVYIYDLL